MKHDTQKTIASVLMVTAILLLSSVVGLAHETGAIDPPPQPVVVTLRPHAERDSAENLWSASMRSKAPSLATDEELLQAMPADAIAIDHEATSEGVPTFTAGGPPQSGAVGRARRDFPHEWHTAPNHLDWIEEPTESSAGNHTALSGNSAYTAFDGNKYPGPWRFHPYSAVGKLYFTTPNGPAYCTASVIGPDTILTSAQCLFDTVTDLAYADFAFCPAARGDACPFGTFPWARAFVLADFMQAANRQSALNLDVALLELDRNEMGERVHSYTGWLGLAWNLPPERHVFAIGYPATKSNAGFSQVCVDQTYEAAMGIQKMGCDSGSGHLGGPWIVNFAPYVIDGANFINSMTSLQYSRGRNEIGGLRFTEQNIGGLCDAAPGC